MKKTTTVKKETVTKKTTAKTTYKPVKMNLQVQYNYHDVYKAETSEVFYIAKTNNKQVLKNDEPLYI